MQRDVTSYIQGRLCSIQSRHNFDRRLGARQIAKVEDRNIRDDYIRFETYIEIANKAGLDVNIPHDPSGLDPLAHLEVRKARPRYLYFACTHTTREWKVGISYHPHKRCAQLQTGNPDRLEIHHKVVGDSRLEALVLRRLARYKSRHRGGREWFAALSERQVREIVRQIRAEGYVLSEPSEIDTGENADKTSEQTAKINREEAE